MPRLALAPSDPVDSWIGDWQDDGELLRGVWRDEEGPVFLDRERPGEGPWTAARAEAAGLHHFYLQGKAHWQCGELNGTPHKGYCPAGALQIVQPGETVRPAGVGRTRLLHVMVSPRFLQAHLGEQDINRLRASPERRGYRGDLGLNQLARMHEVGIDSGLRGTQLYFESLRQAMLVRLIEGYAGLSSGPARGGEQLAPSKARRIVEFIDSSLGEELQLAQLASVAGQSKFHFSRAFRNTMSLSPHAYVVQRRLMRVLGLLRDGRLPVSEIARRCGFADHAHLTRSFKARFGAAPSLLQRSGIASDSSASAA